MYTTCCDRAVDPFIQIEIEMLAEDTMDDLQLKLEHQEAVLESFIAQSEQLSSDIDVASVAQLKVRRFFCVICTYACMKKNINFTENALTTLRLIA